MNENYHLLWYRSSFKAIQNFDVLIMARFEQLHKARFQYFSQHYTLVDALVGDIRAAGVDMLSVKTALHEHFQ